MMTNKINIEINNNVTSNRMIACVININIDVIVKCTNKNNRNDDTTAKSANNSIINNKSNITNISNSKINIDKTE